MEDFGEAMMTGDNGASFYFRVDWFLLMVCDPGGWQDDDYGNRRNNRIAENIDIAQDFGGNQLYLFDKRQEVRLDARGTISHPSLVN